MELIGISGTLILFSSIYSSGGSIAGFNFKQTLLYYLLIPLAGFITMVGVSNELPDEIKNGKFSKYLVKPLNIWFYCFASAISSKVNLLLFSTPFYLIALTIYFQISKADLFSIDRVLLFIFMALLAFIMHFFLDMVVTWMAFWVDDVWSFRHFKLILFTFFGGVSFPLSFLPVMWRQIVDVLPFKYFYYVPVTYLIGKEQVNNLYFDILQIFLWSTIFLLIGLLLWRKGIKKYESYGN